MFCKHRWKDFILFSQESNHQELNYQKEYIKKILGIMAFRKRILAKSSKVRTVKTRENRIS